MATKNNPGEFDCYGALDPDEPHFILKATDPDAPQLVRQWAFDYQRRKMQENLKADPITYAGRIRAASGQLTERQTRKFQEALQCAEAMERWRKAREEDKRDQSDIDFVDHTGGPAETLVYDFSKPDVSIRPLLGENETDMAVNEGFSIISPAQMREANGLSSGKTLFPFPSVDPDHVGLTTPFIDPVMDGAALAVHELGDGKGFACLYEGSTRDIYEQVADDIKRDEESERRSVSSVCVICGSALHTTSGHADYAQST